MVLIADSGSTKVHWCLVTASGQCTDVLTDGINPVFQTEEQIRECISNQLLPPIGKLLWAGTLTHVFFYGAGCTPEKKILVKQALESVFKKAEVSVESDMLGAARGLLGHQPGVACILGTGSGSCAYNGEAIEWCVPSLGFILGDEGSGAVLGKRLVGDLLKNQLDRPTTNRPCPGPTTNLKDLFFEEYHTSVADIIDKVYKQPFPNRFLAKLSRFCADHLDDPRIHALVYDHFVQFIRRNLVQYFNPTTNDKRQTTNGVGFVGSIAYYYRPILEEAMRDEGLPVGRILQDPIEGLKEYHKDAIVPTTE
jgi:N-acetylglucosamine kinase-like BadF-type ATPase